MKAIHKIIFCCLFVCSVQLYGLDIPKPIKDWVTATVENKNTEMQIKTITYPGLNNGQKAIVNNLHVYKLDTLMKIISDTLDIVQSYTTQLSIDKTGKVITMHKITEMDKQITRIPSNSDAFLKMLDMYDTVYLSGNTNDGAIYTFLSNKLPYYNKCDLQLSSNNTKVKRCTFYFADKTYYEKTEMLYEKMEYNVNIPISLFDIKKYVNIKKNIGKGDYESYKVIEN